MSKGHGSQSERSPTGQTRAIQATKYITQNWIITQIIKEIQVHTDR